MANILLIDDDKDFSESLAEQLHSLDHVVRRSDCADDGLRLLKAEPFDLVLLDNKMPRMSGLEFLAMLKDRRETTPIVLMTSAHNDKTVIEAIKWGAFDYVIKPDTFDEILPRLQPILTQALKVTRLPKPVLLPQPGKPDVEDSSLIVGHSKVMLEVLKNIARLANVDESVLILGETGTGKDLVARAIHTNSSRKTKPFVVINCAALNENLLEDELFGHERGAFTGADKLRKGHFEHACGGTLFLDEVGDMPMPLQSKLLRVLENREITRLGSSETVKVDVRILAATHRDLPAAVRERTFRQDLFYRLEGMTIRLPPLRERSEDIEHLAHCFLTRLFGVSSTAPTIHPEALKSLCRHGWPGNIRQLQKVLCRAAGTCQGAQIVADDLDFGDLERTAPRPTTGETSERSAGGDFQSAIARAWQSEHPDLWQNLQDQLEYELLRYALSQPDVSEVQLAKKLGMARGTLRKRREKYGL